MDKYKDPDKLIDIIVDDYPPFNIEELQEEDISVIEDDGEGSLIIRAFGENLNVKILSKDLQNSVYRIRVNGKNFTCRAETNLHLIIKELGFNQSSKSKEKEIQAPMPGMVLNIQVKDGDSVVEGQSLLTLEAMKMENILKAPHNGVIEQILVKEGDKVEKNQILISIE